MLGPVVILLTFIVVQFALWYHAKNVAQAAVEAGARAARGYQATDADGTQAALDAFNSLGGPKVTNGTPQIVPTRNGTNVSMDLRTQSIALLPGITLPINVTAGGPIEQFVGP